MTAAKPAVFLSYASEDAAAAARICADLRSVGIEVWFDQSELKGGETWDAAIRQQIMACALFMPIISAHSRARAEGYFRFEWKLAVDRSYLMAADKAFLMPVIIDDTKAADARVPDKFRDVQWAPAPEGKLPPAFVERVARLLSPIEPIASAPVVAGSPAAPAPAHAAPGEAIKVSGAHRRQAAAAGLIAVVLIAASYVAIDKFRPAKRSAEISAPQSPVVQSSAPDQKPITDKSIAVLPFTDMSEAKNQEYFSDGLSEELIDLLVKIPGLRVPARTSSFYFKGKTEDIPTIAKKLMVAHVLEGSVRKSGNNIRVTAQLIRADTGFHLWSETYDRQLTDIFKLQDDIAGAVVEQLKLTLLSAAAAPVATSSPEAYNVFLQARHLAAGENLDDLNKAVVLYERAVAIDPGFALAYASLADCHIRRVANGVDTDGVGYAKTRAAAERAIALDPKLPEGYVSLAIAHVQYELNWAVAAELLKKAQALDQNNPAMLQLAGLIAQATGSLEAAEAFLRRAIDRDPLNLTMRRYLGRAQYYANHLNDAEATFRRIIELDAFAPVAHYELGRVQLAKRDPAAALAAFEAEPSPAWRTFGLPLAYWDLHRTADAHAALANLVAESAGSEFQVAEAYAYQGQIDEAFRWLDAARVRHDPGVTWTRHDPLLRSLKADPRYAAFLRTVKMPAD